MSEIDDFDRRLLDILQNDATLSVNKMADMIGLSSTPCWNRIQRLTKLGYIKKKVALLNNERVNVGMTIFITMKIDQHNSEKLEQIRKTVSTLPEIMEFYGMSGDTDYLMRVVVPNIQAYDRLYKGLISTGYFTNISSMIVMEEIKSTTALPLKYIGK